MKQVFFILLFSLVGLSLFAQVKRSNFWPFGIESSLDFSNGAPTVGSATGWYTEASASISDTLGNLLFYSDGLQVYDSTHDTMPNGTGLFGCSSSTQGALIVPMPQHPERYYLFTTSCYEENFYRGARYSIIDMSLNNGRGDVTVKNQLISLDYAEELAATYHSNDCDVWIVFHELQNDHYASYLLSDTGLVSPPVISSVGPAYVHIDDTYGRTMLKFNRGGTMAVQTARIGHGPNVHHFDRSTGAFTSYLQMPVKLPFDDPYAACFAPNDSLLYVQARYFTSNTNSAIHQYKLTLPTAQQMSDSAIPVTMRIGDPSLGQLQLGADGKIYYSYYSYSFFGTIDHPNIAGMGCGPNPFSLPLSPHFSFYSLPNFVSQFIGYGPSVGCTPAVAISSAQPELGLRVYPNPMVSAATFDFEPVQGQEYSLVITDMMGRVVRSYVQIAAPFRMERKELGTGVYAYRLMADDRVIGKGKLMVE